MSLPLPPGGTLSPPGPFRGAFSQDLLYVSLTAFPRPRPTLDTILVRHPGLEVTLLVAGGTAVTPSPAATCGQRFHSKVVGVQSGTVEIC